MAHPFGRVLWLLLPLSLGCASSAARIQEAQERADVEYLEELVTTSPHEWVVEEAARTLGAMKAVQTAPSLLNVLNDPNAGPYRRSAAAVALARFERPEAVKPMMDAFDRANDPEERYWLIVGLYRLCPTQSSTLEVQATLQKAESDGDVIIRRAAKKGLFECRKVKTAAPGVAHAG